jgi:sugar transferase (PEP-CTERM/EpsH1 system associated)
VNLLFLAHRLPFPPTKGDKIRSFHLLQFLARRHTVYLGTFVDDEQDMQHLPAVEALLPGRCKIVALPKWSVRLKMASALISGASLSAACFYNGKLQSWVNDLLFGKKIDKAVVFGSAMAPYLLRNNAFNGARVVMDMVDVDSDKWRQYARGSRGILRLLYQREADKLSSLERDAAGSFGATLLVSDFERRSFSAMAPNAANRIHTGRNGVDLTYFDPTLILPNPFPPDQYPIVMTGRMDYRPNSEGAAWFAQQVLPLVRQTVPNAVFYVVGAQPGPELSNLRSNGVVVTGGVDDIRPYLKHAAVAVAPLHMARGIQNKVLEAMAMGKVVVATTPSSRALDIKPGQELLLADDAAVFAEQVSSIASGNGRRDIARAARQHILEHYSWDDNLAIVEQLLQTAPDIHPERTRRVMADAGAQAAAPG